MPRILQGIERDVFTCCTCSGLFLGIQDFSFTESVLKKRVACIGTMQIIKGLGIPNKHFAKQKGRLYRQTPCLQKVDLKITERENRRVDFVRGWDYTIIEYCLAFTYRWRDNLWNIYQSVRWLKNGGFPQEELMSCAQKDEFSEQRKSVHTGRFQRMRKSQLTQESRAAATWR